MAAQAASAAAKVDKVRVPLVHPVLSHKLVTAQSGSDEVTAILLMTKGGQMMVHQLAVRAAFWSTNLSLHHLTTIYAHA